MITNSELDLIATEDAVARSRGRDTGDRAADDARAAGGDPSRRDEPDRR